MKKKFYFLMLTVTILLFSSSNALAARVYGVQNPNNGLFLYTSDENEYYVLVAERGYDDLYTRWIAPESGEPVYRLYNPGNGHHLYTLDQNEVKVLTSNYGWVQDNNGQPVFYSGGPHPIYRLCEPTYGRHILTADEEEYNDYKIFDWNDEGIKMYGWKFTIKHQ